MKCTIVQCVGGWEGQRAESCCCHFGQKDSARNFKNLPPTQRCIGSVSIDCGCDRKRFSSAAFFFKKKERTCYHPVGRAGWFHCKDCDMINTCCICVFSETQLFECCGQSCFSDSANCTRTTHPKASLIWEDSMLRARFERDRCVEGQVLSEEINEHRSRR